ncbi:MAG: CHRD domain-containing protein, partial [Gemmatimonadota bacterium]
MTVRVRMLTFAVTFGAVALFASCYDDDPALSGPNLAAGERFIANLNGANERPNPVQSTGVGTAELTVFGNDSIFFDVKIGQIDSVTLSHIHAGDANTAGGIIYGWPNNNPVTSFPALTQFHRGMIRRTSTFSGVHTFDSLLTRVRAGTAYANVHTRRFGGGEIRGNFVRQ